MIVEHQAVIGVGGSDFVPDTRGRVELGSSATGTATFIIEFETGPLDGKKDPIIIAQPRFPGTEGFQHTSWHDAFAVEVNEVRREGFNVNVARLDKLDNTGWMQLLRLDYFAWLPETDSSTNAGNTGPGSSALHRSGVTKAGRTHKSSHVKGVPRTVPLRVRFQPAFIKGSIPQVVTTPAAKPGQSFSDVHVVIVHEGKLTS